MLESTAPTQLEEVYSRVLDLRERLRVEEIIAEILPDMQHLYRDPPSYAASQLHLRDVRILLIRTCQSLAYMERESSLHGLNLNISVIDAHRISQRSSNHPYHMISTYLKPEAWKEFHNYDNFRDPGRINGGIGVKDWDVLSANDLAENAESSASLDDSEPLGSDDSGVVATPATTNPFLNKSTERVNTHSAADFKSPSTSLGFRQRARRSRRIGWGRANLVKVAG